MPLRSSVRGSFKTWLMGELHQVCFVEWLLGACLMRGGTDGWLAQARSVTRCCLTTFGCSVSG